VTHPFRERALLGLVVLAFGDVANDDDARRGALMNEGSSAGLGDKRGAVLAKADTLVRLGRSAPSCPPSAMQAFRPLRSSIPFMLTMSA
jgi:hypothetical protein